MLVQISEMACSSADVNCMDSSVSVGEATPPPHWKFRQYFDIGTFSENRP